MRKFIQTLLRDERGVTAVEYGILAAIVVGALVAGGVAFKTQLEALWSAVTSGMTDAAGGAGAGD